MVELNVVGHFGLLAFSDAGSRIRHTKQMPSPVSKSELAELEALVVRSLDERSDSLLNVLGYGEVSVALGWPVDEARFVCKRTPPFTHDEFAAYEALVNEYVQRLRERGLGVVDTTLVPLERGDQIVSYLVQPKLDSVTLGHNILRSAEPDADHPFLVALGEVLEVVSPTISIDAQAPNFAWDGTDLTLVDVGTPFLWDANRSLRFDMAPFLRMLPAPTRWLATREMTKLVTRWNDPRRVGVDIVANMWREGLVEWVDPTVEALNRALSAAEPITADEAHRFYKEDLTIWPVVKKLQAIERWWQTSVRRQPYDWFIYSSFEKRTSRFRRKR